MKLLFLVIGLSACLFGPALAHTVDYQVDNEQAVVVSVRLSDEPAVFAEYEVLAPGGETYQSGRTDSEGRLSVVPNVAGRWTVRIGADSAHGIHGKELAFDVGQDMVAHLESRPLVATHTRLVVGSSVLFGLFGLVSLLKPRSSKKTVAE